jgi:muramidase (phage lysozyme)
LNRAALFVAATAALAGGVLWWWSRVRNVLAFKALLRQLEANGRYDVIAGYPAHADAIFTDFSEHPYVLAPNRPRYIGTTASGAYQMVRQTWALARDNLGLTDFSPASQDAAAEWLLKFKVPGQNAVNPEGTGNYELIAAGQFNDAIAQLGPEWESLAKMAQGRYFMTLAQARDFIVAQGGVYVDAVA